MRKASFLLLILASILSIQCNPTIRKLEIVRIGNIRLDSISQGIISLRAELAVRNPYSTSARIKNLSFDLALANDFIAYGKQTESVELKAESIAILDVPLALQTQKVTEQDFAALLSEQIPYRIQGQALLEKPFGPRTVPIEIQNRIQAPQRLQIQLQHKTAGSILTLDRIETRQFLSMIRGKKLPVRLNNPFPFPITIRDLSYEFRWNQQRIAEGTTASELVLSPGENHFEVAVRARPIGAIEGLFRGLIDRQIPDLSFTSEFILPGPDRELAVKLLYIPE